MFLAVQAVDRMVKNLLNLDWTETWVKVNKERTKVNKVSKFTSKSAELTSPYASVNFKALRTSI